MKFLRLCGIVLVGDLLSLQGGCAAPPPIVIPPKPDLFPRTLDATDIKTPGRVALQVPPEVRATGTPIIPNSDYCLRFQTGPMVEQGLLLALGDGLQGGVQAVAMLPAAGAGFGATLVLQSVQLQFRTGWPAVISSHLRAVDAQGRTV